jgi:hypothetical protein
MKAFHSMLVSNFESCFQAITGDRHSLALIGRPAWVGVRNSPEYRGKRIMNHIMDALHARSKDDGTMVQVINGINWVK